MNPDSPQDWCIKADRDFEKSINADVYNKALVIKNYAVHVRYPNPFADPSEADVLEAVECAEFFRSFAVGVLGI